MEIMIGLIQINPDITTAKQLVALPGALEAMTAPFIIAGTQNVAAIWEAWYDQVGDTVVPDSELHRVLDRARRNVRNMPKKIRRIAREGPVSEFPARLEALGDDLRRRAEMSVQWARGRARDLAVMSKPGMFVWKATMDDRTCSYCRGLHGTTIGPGEKFPTNPRYWGGKHPRCRCRIVRVSP